jgi:hypothetical protein
MSVAMTTHLLLDLYEWIEYGARVPNFSQVEGELEFANNLNQLEADPIAPLLERNGNQRV